MKYRSFQGICVAGCLLAAGLVQGQTMPAAATQPDARWSALLERLASPDFPVRQAAQKELDKSTWRDRDTLRQLMQSSNDEEVKASLAGRIAAIDEQLALEPPPLSLEVKDATLTQVAEMLGRQMGMQLKVWPDSEDFRRGMTFTLSAAEKPFWDVFFQLSQQHGLSLQSFGGNDTRIQQSNPGRNRGLVIGPLAIFPTSIVRQHVADLQDAPEKQLHPESLNFSLEACLDPRVNLVKYTNPVIYDVKDDLDNVLYHKEQAEPQLWDANGRHVFTSTVPLAILGNKGRLATAKGECRYIAQLSQVQLEIAQADTKVGQTFEIGGRKITLSKCDIRGTSYDIMMQTPPNSLVRNLGARLAPDGMMDQGIQATMVDAAGHRLMSMNVTGGSGVGGGQENLTLPLKLTLSVPTKFKEVVVPFELKGLPLP